jgi:8-oxo-dGTP diphosphatase
MANDEIRQQYIYFADLKNKDVVIIPCDEGETKWIDTKEVLSINMSYTNSECIKHYLYTGKNDDEIYSGVVKVSEGIPTMIFTPLSDLNTDY